MYFDTLMYVVLSLNGSKLNNETNVIVNVILKNKSSVVFMKYIFKIFELQIVRNTSLNVSYNVEQVTYLLSDSLHVIMNSCLSLKHLPAFSTYKGHWLDRR